MPVSGANTPITAQRTSSVSPCFREQAGIARRAGRAQVEHRDLPVEAHRRARHQRLAERARRRGSPRGGSRSCRCRRARRRPARASASRRLLVDALGQRRDPDFGIDRGERGARRLDLLPADRLGAVHDLALQVGEVHVVVVADRDACRRPRRRDRARPASRARPRRSPARARRAASPGLRCRSAAAGCGGCSAAAVRRSSGSDG